LLEKRKTAHFLKKLEFYSLMNIKKYTCLFTVSYDIHIRMRCLKGYKDKEGKFDVSLSAP